MYVAEHARLVFEGPGAIELGDNVFINARCDPRPTTRPDWRRLHVVVFNVVVMDTNHRELDAYKTTSPTIIGERVWIGARALVLRGVSIADGAVVGAGAIVTRDMPTGALVAGNPARLIRENITWHR